MPRFKTTQELQNFIVNCDENLQVIPGLFTDTAIWYRNWYFAQIFDDKVDFYRVYFDEMKKEASMSCSVISLRPFLLNAEKLIAPPS